MKALKNFNQFQCYNKESLMCVWVEKMIKQELLLKNPCDVSEKKFRQFKQFSLKNPYGMFHFKLV